MVPLETVSSGLEGNSCSGAVAPCTCLMPWSYGPRASSYCPAAWVVQIFLLEHQAVPLVLLHWPAARLQLAGTGPAGQLWGAKAGHGEGTAHWAELL